MPLSRRRDGNPPIYHRHVPRLGNEPIAVYDEAIFYALTVVDRETPYYDVSFRSSGVVDLRPLITKTIALGEINEAMEMLSRGDACKLVLLPNDGKPPRITQQQQARTPDPNISGAPVHR